MRLLASECKKEASECTDTVTIKKNTICINEYNVYIIHNS